MNDDILVFRSFPLRSTWGLPINIIASSPAQSQGSRVCLSSYSPVGVVHCLIPWSNGALSLSCHREQASNENPPMLLKCGHVICRNSMARIMKPNNRFKCPTCPTEQSSTESRLLYF